MPLQLKFVVKLIVWKIRIMQYCEGAWSFVVAVHRKKPDNVRFYIFNQGIRLRDEQDLKIDR